MLDGCYRIFLVNKDIHLCLSVSFGELNEVMQLLL